MKSAVAPVAALLAVMILAACSDATAPAERLAAPETGPLHSVHVSGPDDIPLEPGEEMPAEFYAAATIQGTSLDVGFVPGYAYAIAAMEYFASNARVEVTLKLKGADGKVIDSDSGFDAQDTFLPWKSRLVARALVSTPGECGHTADARATYKIWMSFPIPKLGNVFTWGHRETSFPDVKAQPECPPPQDFWVYIGMPLQFGGGGGSGSNDDQSDDWGDDSPYEGGCLLCQEWIAYLNGEPVYAYWECNLEDYDVCSQYGFY